MASILTGAEEITDALIADASTGPNPDIYATLLSRAADTKEEIDCPSTSILHGQIAASAIFSHSKREIGIFTTRPEFLFASIVFQNAKRFLQLNPKAEVRILTISSMADPVRDCFKDLFPAFEARVSIKSIPAARVVKPETCPNFMYGDDSASRFEVFYLDPEKRISAMTNFGNIERVKLCKKLFEELTSTSKQP